jgi:hypothetical protein
VHSAEAWSNLNFRKSQYLFLCKFKLKPDEIKISI